jgi:adhesin/invasin
VPQNNSAGLTLRADAQQLPLTGTVLVSGQVLSNPTVPVVSKGGIVSNADFASAPALGLLVSIFGNGLADGALGDTGAPLPPQLGSTSVVLSGVELPLLYVSNTQINVAIPFNIQTNTSQQLVVLRGNAVSVPVSLAVFASEPSILSASGSGSGQGLIFNAITGTRSDTNTPAGAGDYLVMYALGLGAVTPNLAIGNGTPSSPYEYAVAPVTVTIGGVPATVLFAGLTPGYVGLYQVNVMMPSGVAPGSQVPVTVSVAGKSGAGNITIATH